jgi:hypothetical protein
MPCRFTIRRIHNISPRTASYTVATKPVFSRRPSSSCSLFIPQIVLLAKMAIVESSSSRVALQGDRELRHFLAKVWYWVFNRFLIPSTILTRQPFSIVDAPFRGLSNFIPTIESRTSAAVLSRIYHSHLTTYWCRNEYQGRNDGGIRHIHAVFEFDASAWGAHAVNARNRQNILRQVAHYAYYPVSTLTWENHLLPAILARQERGDQDIHPLVQSDASIWAARVVNSHSNLRSTAVHDAVRYVSKYVTK